MNRKERRKQKRKEYQIQNSDKQLIESITEIVKAVSEEVTENNLTKIKVSDSYLYGLLLSLIKKMVYSKHHKSFEKLGNKIMEIRNKLNSMYCKAIKVEPEKQLLFKETWKDFQETMLKKGLSINDNIFQELVFNNKIKEN